MVRIPLRAAICVATLSAALPAREAACEQEAGADGDGAPWMVLAKKWKLGQGATLLDIEQGKVQDGLLEDAGGKVRPKHLIWPVKGGRFGRGVGSGKDGGHQGLDIVAPTGTAIKAAAFGIVIWAAERKGYGHTAIVLHSGGWVTLYAHCSKLKVKPGMKVKSGHTIALVGSTGISRGPHLHWELRIDGVIADPAPYVHPSIPHPPHVGPMPWQGYTVKKGDTPAKIAQKKGLDLDALLKLNKLDADSALQVGWKIALPVKVKGKEFKKGEYKVKSGDTLSSIAMLYDVPVQDLLTLNGLADGDKISPGQWIKVPDGAYSGNAISQKAKEKEEKDSFVWHEVQQGESLFSIAKKYDTSITVIANMNGIKDKDKLSLGQKIKVPAPAKEKKKGKGKGKGKKGGEAGTTPAPVDGAAAPSPGEAAGPAPQAGGDEVAAGTDEEPSTSP